MLGLQHFFNLYLKDFMARKSTATPQDKDATDAAVTLQPLNQMAVITNEIEERVFALAHSLGYDGALTVGGLEDEIRFYQKVTVEGMLRLGKLLLLLKEATPHGEFEARVELLGFGLRSAQNFMAAAKKVSKSASAALLAEQVKDRKAFLELITHDDGVMKELAEMDEFDKMSASQLRAAARDLAKQSKGIESVNAELHKKMDSLKAKHAGIKVVAATDWPAAFTVLMDQATGAGKDFHRALDGLKAVLQAAIQVEPASEQEEASLIRAQESLAEVMQAILSKGMKRSAELALLFDQTIAPGTTAGQVEQPA